MPEKEQLPPGTPVYINDEGKVRVFTPDMSVFAGELQIAGDNNSIDHLQGELVAVAEDGKIVHPDDDHPPFGTLYKMRGGNIMIVIQDPDA